MRIPILVVLVSLASVASFAGESYMNLVGQLYSLELPRLTLQICKSAQPQLAASAEEQYESWMARNAAFLEKARHQFERANARLKVQGHSLDEMDAAILRKFESVDSRTLCSSFSAMLALKDQQIGGEFNQLLTVVTQADEELAKREEHK